MEATFLLPPISGHFAKRNLMITVLKRAFTSNLQTVSPSPREQSILKARGIHNPTLQTYFAWRYSLMIVVVVATILSAGLSTYRDLYEDDQRPDVFETIYAQISKTAITKIPEVAIPDSVLPAVTDAVKAQETEDEEPMTDKQPDANSAAPSHEHESPSDSHKKQKSLLSKLDEIIHLVSLYILPVAAVCVILFWTQFNFTFRIMLAAFGFSFLAPILLSFCPWSWWDAEAAASSSPTSGFDKTQQMADGLVEGLSYLAMLMPAVLSMLPGVQKACVRVKTLLPQSVLPGWFLVTAAPFYALFLLVIFVAINQIFGNPFVFIGMLLVMSSSLIYGIRMDVSVRPLLCEDDYRKLYTVQRIAGMMTLIAGCSFLYYVTSHDVLGIHLMGLDPKTSLLLPLDIVEFVLEIISRSMFMTVFGADLFMRMNLAAWKNARQFYGSPESENYDAIMDEMQQNS
jgi:hypothetical protein